MLPSALTGVEAKIVVLPADHFPMIHAHKVLAAYGCLAPRVITGQFDPTHHRAIWPSTGNYCRGGIAISRIMDCRGVAVLPEGMSRSASTGSTRGCRTPRDIIRTHGTESNVKEIYDKCAELDQDPDNIIFNQFSEFGNYLATTCAPARRSTGSSTHLQADHPELQLRGLHLGHRIGGTLAAGDYLKERHGAWIVAVEALECPTMLYNGFGEHNIQGIGDKHIPLIHNVMNTDALVAISDAAPTSCWCSSTPTKASAIWPSDRECPTRLSSPAPIRVLLHLQHPGRYQDGQVPRSRIGRCRRNRGHRWCRAVPQRAREDPRPAIR